MQARTLLFAMDKTHRLLIDNANKMGVMNVSSFAKIISEDENSFWEWWAQNNPAGILGAYIKAGNTQLVQHPHVNNIYPIIRKLIDQGNYKELVYLLNNVPYMATVQNTSTNPAVWAALGCTPGDFFGVYSKYYSNNAAKGVGGAIRGVNPPIILNSNSNTPTLTEQ